METFVLGKIELSFPSGTDERNDPVVAEGAPKDAETDGVGPRGWGSNVAHAKQ